MTDAYRDACLHVELVDALDAGNERFVARLVDLVNAAYAETEGSLWVDGRARIDAERLSASIAAGDIAVARWDGVVVGCVRIERLDAETAGFGLLATDARHRDAGIGRELVAFAERTARERGATTMELELLLPLDGVHPFKARLDAWYRRLGYGEVGRRAVEDVEPGAEHLLEVPCAFAIYRKRLTGSR